MKKLFKVLDGKQSIHGGDAVWIPRKWMPKMDVNPCQSGYHLCREKDLVHWLGPEIWIAVGRGKVVECEDKIVFEQAKILKKMETWNDKTARFFACWCVRQIWHLLTDDRSKKAVVVAEAFAEEKATMEELAAARAAARDAAWAAARDAAWAAARAAARDAARDAAWDAARDAARAAARAATRAAARDAARAAARDAAWDAAMDAAWDAARAAQTKRLIEILFPEENLRNAAP